MRNETSHRYQHRSGSPPRPGEGSRSADVARKNGSRLFLSDFSLHSIGLILFRRKQHEVFRQFLNDMVLRAGATLVFLSGQEMEAVADVGLGSNLDFDDAYQYALAERYALIIVSFDSDFDRTALGRLTPADIV